MFCKRGQGAINRQSHLSEPTEQRGQSHAGMGYAESRRRKERSSKSEVYSLKSKMNYPSEMPCIFSFILSFFHSFILSFLPSPYIDTFEKSKSALFARF
jgi:hypothetical protein